MKNILKLPKSNRIRSKKLTTKRSKGNASLESTEAIKQIKDSGLSQRQTNRRIKQVLRNRKYQIKATSRNIASTGAALASASSVPSSVIAENQLLNANQAQYESPSNLQNKEGKKKSDEEALIQGGYNQ